MRGWHRRTVGGQCIAVVDERVRAQAPEHANNLPPVPQLHKQPLIKLLDQRKACSANFIISKCHTQQGVAVNKPYHTVGLHSSAC